jgi:DNA-binding transcriptional LysR family regulator
MVEAAVDGIRIAFVPDFLVADPLRCGHLLQVLEDRLKRPPRPAGIADYLAKAPVDFLPTWAISDQDMLWKSISRRS